MLVTVLGFGVLWAAAIAWAQNEGEGGFRVFVTLAVGVMASLAAFMILAVVMGFTAGEPNGPEDADHVEEYPLSQIEHRDGRDYYVLHDVDDEEYFLLHEDEDGQTSQEDYEADDFNVEYTAGHDNATFFKSWDTIHNGWIAPFGLPSNTDYTLRIPEGSTLNVGEHDS